MAFASAAAKNKPKTKSMESVGERFTANPFAGQKFFSGSYHAVRRGMKLFQFSDEPEFSFRFSTDTPSGLRLKSI